MRRNVYLALPLIVVGVLLMAFLGLVGLIIGIILVLGGIAMLALGYMGRKSAPS
jgi:hypothetical protein